MTDVNDKVFLYVLDPVARGYSLIMPQPVRIGLSNVMNNLKAPLYFTNNLRIKRWGYFYTILLWRG